jgi:hypothetical protein
MEYQIVVQRDYQGDYWYTAQKRKVYFLFRGFWKNITPLMQPTYQDALDLIHKD